MLPFYSFVNRIYVDFFSFYFVCNASSQFCYILTQVELVEGGNCFCVVTDDDLETREGWLPRDILEEITHSKILYFFGIVFHI